MSSFGTTSNGVTYSRSTTHCEGGGARSKEEQIRRRANRDHARHTEIAAIRDEAAVALDAMIEGRGEYAKQIDHWQWLALWLYRQQWKVPAIHPWRYETTCAPSNRRASTLGEMICRFCGVVIVAKCKYAGRIAKSNKPEGEYARRHLAICALHVLAGLRESVSPTHRVGLIEAIETGMLPLGDNGPLFGSRP